jgi:hypothetical protein
LVNRQPDNCANLFDILNRHVGSAERGFIRLSPSVFGNLCPARAER